MKRYSKQDFPLHQIRQHLETEPIVLVASAWKGETNIMTMGWHTVMEFTPARAGSRTIRRRWKGKSMIGGGRQSVRCALFVAAMVAGRHSPVLKAFRDRLIANGKPKIVTIIAVARKLLTILNAILRDKQPWQTV